MEQIERLINKTLKFFFIHNEGENNKKANNEHYYKRDIDKLLNYEPNDFLVKNINEEYELKSIPSEDYEESEEESQKISNNDILSSVKTIIKEEEDEEDSFNEEELKDTGLKKIDEEFDSSSSKIKGNLLNNKDINSENKKNDNNDINDNNDNVSQKNKENSNSINNLNSSSLNSSKTIETVRTNIKNELIDYVSEKNERDTLISSNIPYSSEEINNENFPFEDTIIIHKNETLSSDLLPKNYLNNSNLNSNKILFDGKYSSKHNTPNNLLYLLNNPNNSNNNNSNNQKIIIKISSFDSLHIHKLESFTLFGNILNLKKLEQNKKKTNSIILINETKRSSNSLDRLLINKKQIQNEKDENEKLIFEKNLLNLNLNNQKPFNTPKEKIKNNYDHFKKGFSQHFLKFKQNKHHSLQLPIPNSQFFDNNNNQNKNRTSKKLNLISNNIRTNSIILNNPTEFYFEFFNSVMGKEDYKNKNNVSNRLQNISKMIESKRDSYASNMDNDSNLENSNKNFNNLEISKDKLNPEDIT